MEEGPLLSLTCCRWTLFEADLGSIAMARASSCYGTRQCHGSTMALPWQCHGVAMASPWQCHGTVMALPWQCHGLVVALPGQCHGHAMESPWQCHVIAMALPCQCIRNAMVMAWWCQNKYTIKNDIISSHITLISSRIVRCYAI